jgi:alcohol dehydrogenase class IV
LSSDQKVWSLAELKASDLSKAALWATRSVRSQVEQELGINSVHDLRELGKQTDTLIAVGGGTLLDEAKAWAAEVCPDVRLVAIPSIWGSGAEASPIAVLNRGSEKQIRIGPEYLPEIRVEWPELAKSVPEALAAWACGDVWAHALEGFLSPLAGDSLRAEIAILVREMLEAPIVAQARWFDLSARACRAQSQSSVGLVHGIAHVLEPIMRDDGGSSDWGHARLCSLFLYPVMLFNRQGSCKWSELIEVHGLSENHILQACKTFFSAKDYGSRMPYFEQSWNSILRDRCSRTNCVLVRPQSLSFFTDTVFH